VKKRTSIFMLLILVVGVLAACGKASEESSSEPTDNKNSDSENGVEENEKVELTYFSWDPSMEKTNQRLIDQFEKNNPNIEIELQSYEPSNYWPKISAMAAAGNAPDVFDMSSGFVDEWAAKDLLYNLQEFVDTDLNKDDYYTSVFNAVRYPDKQNGDMFAFPYAWVTTNLFYNKSMFDEAGLDYPTNDWTWDEFLSATKQLTQDKNGDGKTDQWGFWFYGRYAQIEPWIYQNNGRLLNEDKTKFAIDDNAKEALQFLTDLTTEHKVSPRPKDMQGTNQQDLFPTGKAAMWVDGSWNIENNRNIIKGQFDWGITTVPRGENWTEDVTYGWPDNIAIFKESEHPKEAWEFIKFMTGKERSVENYAGGKVPIYKETAESEAWLEEDKKPGNKKLILEQGEHMGRNSFTRNWSEWRGYGAAEGSGMNGEIDQVLDGVKTFDDAIESLTKYANDVLERSNQN
jgi:multiple sugar transport system substrate-binding protein